MAKGKCIVCGRETTNKYIVIHYECYSKLLPVRVKQEGRKPCQQATHLVKRDKQYCTVANILGNAILVSKVKINLIHQRPCRKCADHPFSFFPQPF